MRDEMDARIWNEHHDQFSEWIDGGVVAAGAQVRRAVAAIGDVPRQLLAGVAALSVTVLTFTSSIA